MLKGDRSGFLGLGQTLAGGTNALVVIAWGHGGGRAIRRCCTCGGRGSRRRISRRWRARRGRGVALGADVSGQRVVRRQLAGERRQIIASEGETMFSDDPVGMPLLLKMAREKPELPFEGLARSWGGRQTPGTRTATWRAPRSRRFGPGQPAAAPGGLPRRRTRRGDEAGGHQHAAAAKRNRRWSWCRATCRRCGRRSSGSRRRSIRRPMRSSCGGG